MWTEKDCVIEHEGRKYEAGGAVITPDVFIAYVGKKSVGDCYPPHRELTDWHGNVIGECASKYNWRVGNFVGKYMHQIVAKVDGVFYTGRGMGMGEGCVFRGKRKAKQCW